MKVGSMYTPLLANDDMAPTISYTDKSNTPNAIDGTGINFEVSIPSCATLSKTSFIIPLFLIMLAVMLFMEDARAKNIGVGSPVYAKSEFEGHHN